MFGISLDGIFNSPTYNLASGITSADIGKVVSIQSAKTARIALNNERFFGILMTVDKDNLCGVIEQKGYQKVKYSDTAPSLGFSELAGDGTGGVRSVAVGNGNRYLVAEVDTVNSIATIFLG